MNRLALAIHGGAGTIERSKMTPEKEVAYLHGLDQSINEGFRILSTGGSALDAVEACVKILEDNPLFNAGKGAVFTADHTHEMDASVMWGPTLEAGAVAGVSTVKNPIALARKVMEKSAHVLLHGNGAEAFGRMHGIEFESPEYFFTKEREAQLLQAKKSDGTFLDHSDDQKFGTVGAVAIDRQGNLAAATSTGGMTNKKFGRIGDSPIIGAGNYANDNTCAVSCTGHGEFFIRTTVAHDISCLMEYKNLSLEQACEMVVLRKLKKIGGAGGVIAVDKRSNLSLVFNTAGMFRAWKKEGAEADFGIYK